MPPIPRPKSTAPKPELDAATSLHRSRAPLTREERAILAKYPPVYHPGPGMVGEAEDILLSTEGPEIVEAMNNIAATRSARINPSATPPQPPAALPAAALTRPSATPLPATPLAPQRRK